MFVLFREEEKKKLGRSGCSECSRKGRDGDNEGECDDNALVVS